MSQMTNKRMQEFFKWFLEHKHQARDVEKKTDFTYDVVVNMVNVMASMAQDINVLEQDNEPKLVLPRGIKFDGPLKRP